MDGGIVDGPARWSGPLPLLLPTVHTHFSTPKPPQVKALMVLFYPVAKPVALLLDRLLGQELRTVYSKEELVKMLEIHVRAFLEMKLKLCIVGFFKFGVSRGRSVRGMDWVYHGQVDGRV